MTPNRSSAQSSKSLFRATKPKPKTDARQSEIGIPMSVKPMADIRRADDFYPTGQPEAIRALFALDGDRIRQCDGICDLAVGDGALAREIVSFGMPFIGADIVDRGWPGTILKSYYKWEDSPYQGLIQNPPYSEINARDGHGKWLRHTLSMRSWTYSALLLSADWDFAKQNGLGQLIDENPYSYCYKMRWKLDFTGEGSPPQRNAWFVWSRDDPRSYSGTLPEPSFRFLDRIDGRQAELNLSDPQGDLTPWA